jgi:hypothetical protein
MVVASDEVGVYCWFLESSALFIYSSSLLLKVNIKFEEHFFLGGWEAGDSTLFYYISISRKEILSIYWRS